jgi:hypothetical protein
MSILFYSIFILPTFIVLLLLKCYTKCWGCPDRTLAFLELDISVRRCMCTPRSKGCKCCDKSMNSVFSVWETVREDVWTEHGRSRVREHSGTYRQKEYICKATKALENILLARNKWFKYGWQVMPWAGKRVEKKAKSRY